MGFHDDGIDKKIRAVALGDLLQEGLVQKITLKMDG